MKEMLGKMCGKRQCVESQVMNGIVQNSLEVIAHMKYSRPCNAKAS